MPEVKLPWNMSEQEADALMARFCADVISHYALPGGPGTVNLLPWLFNRVKELEKRVAKLEREVM